MPYTATRRLHHISGRKVSKYAMYRKARRMCNEINSKLSFLESKFLKSRLHNV
ncbi:MAG: hypothetical protein Q8R38_00850 [Candidatus Omnitrophota bacterium]|nr:hypothetical protein [Candidatus Omnitrophota bacterium]